MLREMVETSSSKSTRSISSNVDHREIFISKVIESAIREKSCPICLRRIDVDDNKRRTAVLTVCMHVYCIDCIRKWSELKRNCPLCNAEFDSWFFRISVSTGKFEKERLPKFEERKEIGFSNRRRERANFPYQRSLSRSRGERHTENRRSRPLPWRRSFGQPRYVPNSERQQQEEIVAERVLRWRASIYTQQLQAIPLPSGNRGEKNTLGSNGMKERVERRVEPWIARELQAILGDLDTSVIVHVATSLYVLSLEQKLKGPTSQPAGGDNFIEPLRRFLHDRTNMFWHELRCFDESSLAMEIYDTVVEYKQLEKVQNGE